MTLPEPPEAVRKAERNLNRVALPSRILRVRTLGQPATLQVFAIRALEDGEVPEGVNTSVLKGRLYEASSPRTPSLVSG